MAPAILWAVVLLLRSAGGFMPVAGLWQGTGGPSAVVAAVVLDGRQVLAGGVQGLFSSEDQGISWRVAPGVPEGTSITALTAMDGRAYAGGQGRLWERLGESWQAVQAPGDWAIHSLLVTNGQLLAASDGGLHAREIEGASGVWRRVWPVEASPPAAVFAIHDADEGLLLGTDDGVVLLKQDNPASLGLGPVGVRVLGVATGEGWMYAAVPEPQGGLFRARAGSNDWQKGGVASSHGVVVIVDPRRPSHLMAGLGGLADGREIAGVVESSDFGATWSPLQSRLQNTHVHALTLDTEDGVLFAGTNGGGLFYYREPTLAHMWLRGASPLLDVAEPALLGLVGLGLLVRRRSSHR
jgi:hypothetical protein